MDVYDKCKHIEAEGYDVSTPQTADEYGAACWFQNVYKHICSNASNQVFKKPLQQRIVPCLWRLLG
jgi:hypothetical protein